MKIEKLDIVLWGGFMVFSTSSVITPICLPEISKTLSTSLSEGGGMESARTAIMVTVLLLSGILAQKWGKKLFLGSGQFLLTLGLLLAGSAESYTTFIVSLMIIGIGCGVSEALLSPLVIDLHPDDSGAHMNVTHAFYPIGIVVSALLFGELLTLGLSWRWLFRLTAVAAFVIAILYTSFRFPPAQTSEHSAGHLIRKILALPGFWLFSAAIFLGAGVESAFTFWSTSYVATYLKDLPRAGAFAVVIFSSMLAVGRLISAPLSRAFSMKRLMSGSAVLGLIVCVLIPFTDSLIGFYLLLALAGMATACFWPTILTEAANALQVDATILCVLLSCFGIAGFGFAPWLLGIIGDRSELKTAFSVMPVFFVLLLVVLFFEQRMSRKSA